MTKPQQIHPITFFEQLVWIDGRPLLDVIEPYRRRILEQVLWTFDDLGRPRFNLALTGRSKKNWKSADLSFAALYRLLAWKTTGGNTCLIVASDEDQADDDLQIVKKLIAVNPPLADAVNVLKTVIERKDGEGFLEILPGRDVAGAHGKSFLFLGIDELHTQRDWSLLEALQPDPHRSDVLTWITSYASLLERPGVPLADLCRIGWRGKDPRMFFDWHSGTQCTDPACDGLSPEERANPSRAGFDPGYLQQQKERLPSHQFRRLHLNIGGQPEGAAFDGQRIADAIERGVKNRPYIHNVRYAGFVDMSGGSSDDATLAIGHKEGDKRDAVAVLDVIVNQGPRPPFDPRKAVERFSRVLKDYGISEVSGDAYGGETFRADFREHGISYRVIGKSKSELYESLEPRLNSSQVILLDHSELEAQLLSLIWRGGRIDHPAGEHDDFANSAAGVADVAMGKKRLSCVFGRDSYDQTRNDLGINERGRRIPDSNFFDCTLDGYTGFARGQRFVDGEVRYIHRHGPEECSDASCTKPRW